MTDQSRNNELLTSSDTNPNVYFLQKKQELEILKLEQEIKNLKKEWFKNPAYLGFLFPSLVAIISFVYAIFNGVFDMKYQQYKIEKASLEYDVKLFQDNKKYQMKQRDSAISEIESAKSQLSNLQLIITSLQNKIDNNRASYIYDSSGNLIKARYENGDSVSFRYDFGNRLITFINIDGDKTNYMYTIPSGKLVSITNSKGKSILFTYDKSGNLIKQE